jgi:hypothetical protein
MLSNNLGKSNYAAAVAEQRLRKQIRSHGKDWTIRASGVLYAVRAKGL